jgi:hypothetical protein
MLGIANAGELEDVRRADRAGSKDHLAGDIDAFRGTIARILDAYRARAVEKHPMHQRIGDDPQIGAPHCGLQIAPRGTCTSPSATCLLHPADTVAGFRCQVVDVLPVLEAELLARLDCRLAQQRPVATMRGEQRTALAVHGVFLALPVLRLAEEWQHVVPRPAAIAELGPVVEILRLAAHVDHAVDRARSAEDTAAGVVDDATIGAGIGLGLEAPGKCRVVQQLHVACRDVDQRIPVPAACFDEYDAVASVLGQSVGQTAAGRAGADDDVVSLHVSFPPDGML